MLKKSALSALMLVGLASAYIVKRGDTIWDLSGQELRDPFAWGMIWQANPQVKNPHQIFPGQKLNLPQIQANPSDEDVQVQKSNTSKAQADEDFKKALGPLIRDPAHRPLNFIPAHSNLKAPKSQTAWLSHSVQLEAPFWVLPYSENKLFENVYQPTSVGSVNGQIVQNGQHYTINSKLKLNQVLELYQNDEAKYSIKNQIYVAHKPLGFARVVEAKENESLIKVEYLLGALKVDKLEARPNPNHFPTSIKSFTKKDQIDFNEAATLAHFMIDAGVVSPGDFALLDKGNADGFDLGDAVVVWDRTKGDSSNLSPKILAYGLIVHSDVLGSTLIIKEMASMNQMPKTGFAVSVYAKALK